jgi:hypothetical protein
VNGIIIYSAGRLWARGAVGSASDWQSEGQGFESPRVHQSFEYRIDVTLASYRPSRLGLTHYLALPPPQPLAWFMSQGPVCTALRRHQIEPRALAASALLARGRARARQAVHLIGYTARRTPFVWPVATYPSLAGEAPSQAFSGSTEVPD